MNKAKNYIAPLALILDMDCEGMLCASPDAPQNGHHQSFGRQENKPIIWD